MTGREWCKTWWKTFSKVLTGLLDKPMWMMLLLSLCVMSLVYANRTVWDLPVAVIDQDHSTASRMLARQLDAGSKIATVAYDNLAEAEHDLALRKLFAVIIMPVDLEKKILAGQNIVIPVYGDATNRLANGQIQQDVLSAYQSILTQYNTDLLLSNGFSERQASVVLSPILGQSLDVFNPGISFAAIIFPGLLVMLLQHSLLIASVRVSIVLNSGPSGKPAIPAFLGGISALIPVWLFLSIVLFVLWPWVLGYRQTASIPEILLLTFPFLLAVLGLGKLVTECLRSVELIYLTLAFLTTPVFYISGTIWPLQAMPAWVRAISSMLPSTWATKAIAGVNQMGLPFKDVGGDILMLLILCGFYTFIGIAVGMLRDGVRLRAMFRPKPPHA
ncbi:MULTISPECIES: ABC transporter permease [Rahnella]|jgi:ABC-2 type transport system permease protein|uniref:ABC transporter permease n=1 Tax=Rahnella victoriana TaxID=1510570 RepID=A0ABS0DW75_9GAMM|nr:MULTISPECIES: ABC transporter permease [Rahnella]VTQ57044.1 daunorubicin resistance ABC transporter membrane protein [Campylobacter jejuni]MBF7958116.1 ABC transporter permease [Rahnella victoriana]PBI80697.1 ABC transporter permease [Rahnella victoriana]TBX32018.1 ABC transporter permease [Rahnella victoriana]TDS90706.1 ABC-2 type transport system permease protein [Rahnella sp. BIGb0236]